MSNKMPEYRVQLARRLRLEETPTEQLLWAQLRGRGIGGYKFRRQQPLGRYIADFCCHSAKLVVEIDGAVHQTVDAQEYDEIRNHMMEAFGYRVLRLSTDEVEQNIEAALQKIAFALPDTANNEEQ